MRCSVRRPGKLSVAPNTASVVSMAEAWRACGSLSLAGSGPTPARMQHASVQNSTTGEQRWHRADNTRNERDRSCALRHAPRAAFRAPGRFLVCICVPTLCSASSGQSGQRGPRPAQSSPQSSPPLQRTSAESSKQHQAAPSRHRPRSHRTHQAKALGRRPGNVKPRQGRVKSLGRLVRRSVICPTLGLYMHGASGPSPLRAARDGRPECHSRSRRSAPPVPSPGRRCRLDLPGTWYMVQLEVEIRRSRGSTRNMRRHAAHALGEDSASGQGTRTRRAEATAWWDRVCIGQLRRQRGFGENVQ